jgi:glycine hydroxymethyltransferase
MAHISGLVAGGAHPSPIPYADVVTTTTHKTLRGPRGAMILCKEVHAKAIDKAVFPGLQGGPHNATTAALAVALKEALEPSFRTYAANVVANAKTLAAALTKRGFNLISGGTDNHLMLIDLNNKSVSGKIAATALEKAGIVLNYNTVPGETRKASDPSGIRLGTPAVTSRGFGAPEMEKIATWIDRALKAAEDEAELGKINDEVAALCAKFPVPGLD